MTYRLSYHNGWGWGLRWKETYDSSWKDAKLVFRIQTDCKCIARQINVLIGDYLLIRTYSGLNVSKISGKWEENVANLTLDQEWPKTASIEVKMMPSY